MKIDLIKRLVLTSVTGASLLLGTITLASSQEQNPKPEQSQEKKDEKKQENKKQPKRDDRQQRQAQPPQQQSDQRQPPQAQPPQRQVDRQQSPVDQPQPQERRATQQQRATQPEPQLTQPRQPVQERQQQNAQQQRQNQYNQQRQQQDRLVQQRARQLEQQRRQARLQIQQQYQERIRQDQLNLQNARAYEYSAPNYRYVRGGRSYQTNQYGVEMIRQGLNYGYEEGYRAGQADREDRARFSYQDSYEYQDATYGYNSYHVDLTEYRYYFREGFNRGYQDGYYGRFRYGSNTNGAFSLLGNILQQIFNARRY